MNDGDDDGDGVRMKMRILSCKNHIGERSGLAMLLPREKKKIGPAFGMLSNARKPATLFCEYFQNRFRNDTITERWR